MIGNRRTILIVFLLLAMLLVACGDEDIPTVQPTSQVPAVETAPVAVGTPSGVEVEGSQGTQDPTPIPPSPTPTEPLAALVNGSPIFLFEYENELARFQQTEAQLGPSEVNTSQRVIDLLIERELITQAAAAAGITVTEEEINGQIAELQQETESAEDFAAWLQANQLTEAEFREAITAELLTQKMMEQVTAEVPLTAAQTHARYIRVDDPELAQSLLDQINTGADFGELAKQYSQDPLSAAAGGDLGFYSPGSLLVPELEAAAAGLEPGQTSQVVPVTHFDGAPTFYLLQVIERDAQRTLSENQRNALLQQTIVSWIAELRAQAEITIFVDTSA